MLENLKSSIESMKIFHALDNDEIDFLMTKFSIQDYQEKQNICIEGEMGRELYVILKGSVGVYKEDFKHEGCEIITLKEMDSFGEMTLIDMQPRSATITCLEETIVASLTNKALYEIYMTHKDLYIKIILNISRELSRRLREMDTKLVEFSHFCKDE